MSESEIALLSRPQGNAASTQWRRHLMAQTEVVLKGLVNELRNGQLTFEKAACGLGRITGYYDMMAQLEREERTLQTAHIQEIERASREIRS